MLKTEVKILAYIVPHIDMLYKRKRARNPLGFIALLRLLPIYGHNQPYFHHILLSIVIISPTQKTRVARIKKRGLGYTFANTLLLQTQYDDISVSCTGISIFE
jgi:hypothetical protein